MPLTGAGILGGLVPRSVSKKVPPNRKSAKGHYTLPIQFFNTLSNRLDPKRRPFTDRNEAIITSLPEFQQEA
jgi:hypothetical protein